MENEYLIPRVIAEIGCNHKGEMKIAKQLLKVAAYSEVNVAKFQKRNNKELLIFFVGKSILLIIL